MIKLNDKAPGFEAQAFVDHDFKKVSLEDYKGKYVVLFFYPADFTFVCPTELEDMAENYEKLQEMNVEVLSVSTDTHFVHAAWHNDSPRIKKIKFPMVSDATHEISKAYEVLIENEGIADRATFLIDPEGFIKMIEMTDGPVGRNAEELLRRIEAQQFTVANPGMACPANWKKGKDTLKPGIDMVGKL
jgi:peroxiredoxin (alkyl hydroperoxide reductase subunit C)